jgi:hypothetical protein
MKSGGAEANVGRLQVRSLSVTLSVIAPENAFFQ